MSTIARFSLAEYDQMIALGFFEGEKRRHVELIRGEVREMSPSGPSHEVVVDRLNHWSVRSVPEERIWVRVQNSIGLPAEESVPEPDIAWVAPGDYWSGRPLASAVLLLIEVADSSLEYDRGEKAALYAAAGIADYGIANLPERTVEVRREPRGGRYRSIRIFAGDEEIRPLALPEAVLRPAMLWSGEA
ncbi:MAG: Uma2 family endonuclease [Thermoguttaceae bacterium]|jgi:Uma2 family endonuclease|nr:Uma2 family endonuclease [Thermoguttaceae bacterium]